MNGKIFPWDNVRKIKILEYLKISNNYYFSVCYYLYMLYTRKGDKGMTTVFGCDLPAQAGRGISKSSATAEALGALDEINSFLGLCKVHKKAVSFKLSAISFSEIVHQVQQNLFIIQAELAGVQNLRKKAK